MKKTCTKCRKTKPVAEYYKEKRARDGRRADCKECSEERRRKRLGQLTREERRSRLESRRIKHAQAERDYSRRRRERYRANELIRLAKIRAEKKGLSFDLDRHVQELTERVDKDICEMTGIPLQRVHPKRFNSPSLDRADPSKGYLYSNVRVVCYALNCALGTWGEDTLIAMVSELMKRKS